MHRKILWQLQIAYFEIFRRFIWLLRKAQFFGYCASIILQLRISQLFIYCKSTNYFTTGNRINNWLLCIEKLYDNFSLPIWKHFDDLYGFCAKTNFLDTAHHTIIFPLYISKLFVYSKSTNYFTTGNRLNTWLLCIEKLHDNFKSPIWNVSTIYMATAQNPNFLLLRIYHFAPAHLPILYLVQIDQLFHHCKSSKYWLLCIEKLYDNFKSPTWK